MTKNLQDSMENQYLILEVRDFISYSNNVYMLVLYYVFALLYFTFLHLTINEVKVISIILKIEIGRWHQLFFVLLGESNISEVALFLVNIF